MRPRRAPESPRVRDILRYPRIAGLVGYSVSQGPALKTGAFHPGVRSRAALHHCLDREPVLVRAGRNRTKADVRVHADDAGDPSVVVKDYSARPAWIRWTLGRWLVRRECEAYLAAGGSAGLPGFLGRVGPYALATAWVDGTPLAELDPGDVDPAVFDRLDEVLGSLHREGVAMADLHHRDVLCTRSREVVVVDLATAVVLGNRPGWVRRRLFRRASELDRIAAARLRARFTGGSERDAVTAIGGPAARWHRRGRRLKGLLRLVRGRGRHAGSDATEAG